jgi:FtsZ-binding cell division protein ZapB
MEDISDIPKSILRSIASKYRLEVYELRTKAYQLLRKKGDDVWKQIKKEAEASDNRIEYWQEKIQWALLDF